MTRPDPVLEKWLQEQERKLLRAQTDMIRIQQQPRRGSAGEALIQNASNREHGINRDCATLCPNIATFKLTLSGLEDVEAVDSGCSDNRDNLSLLNDEWMFQGYDTNGDANPLACDWYPPAFDESIDLEGFCAGTPLTQMLVRYRQSTGKITFILFRGGSGCEYRYEWEIDDASFVCSGVNTLTAINTTGALSPLGRLGCGTTDLQIAGTSTPWDHSMATVTIENLY